MDIFLILFGILFNSIGTLFYFIGTLKGNIKPNKITFALWTFTPLVVFWAQIDQHVGIQTLMTLSISLLPFSVLVASFFNKNAYWKIQKFDLICGFLSLLGLFLWYITKVGNIAIIFSILSDGLAALPTFVKAYYYPETESGWPWLGAVASGILTLITIKQWNFETYGFPLYYTLMMFGLFFVAQTKIGKKLSKKN